MATVSLTSVRRVVGDTNVLDGVTLDVAQGELLVVVGSSGSGKTSLIRAVAGLDALTAGTVFFDDEDVTNVKVADRDVGIVFQDNTLFPRFTARDNVGFPLRIRSMRRDVIKDRVDAEARSLRIEDVLERWPKQLSAGHAQLVQIARAMVRVPRVLLLDEPMAHLDMPTRRRLRRELRELQRGYGVTTIYATNDPAEAVYMADRIAAIDAGRVQQVGPPDELYAAPANVHIAWLTGPVSFLEATVERDVEGFWLVGDGFRLRAWAAKLDQHVGLGVRIGIRPDGIRLQPDSRLRGVVDTNSFEGGTPVTRLRVGAARVTVKVLDAAHGPEVGINVDRMLLFDASGTLIAAVG